MNTETNLIVLCFLGLLSFSKQNLEERGTYKAAVVEYSPYYSPTATPEQIINNNIDKYIEYIENASEQGVDIIVFPECGITTIHLPAVREKILTYASYVPTAKDNVVVCNNRDLTNKSKAIERLSCTAAKNKIYIVVNLVEVYNCKNDLKCPSDGVFIYNTNVVFDRTGAIVARYRKVNLFVEPGFDVTETPELVTFTTDFGVTFGTFICFDMLFETPATDLVRDKNIHDFIYTTAWFSEVPFLTAVEIQDGWANSNDVNLLAAGYNNPLFSNGGSGIYIGRKYFKAYMPKVAGSKMIIANVPKTIYSEEANRDFSSTDNDNKIEKSELKLSKDNFTSYTTELLDFSKDREITKQLCSNELCCNFEIKVKSEINHDYQYRIVAFDGTRPYGFTVIAGIQSCALVACLNENLNTCGDLNRSATKHGQLFKKISINGNFRKSNSTFQFPTALTYDIMPVKNYKYNFSADAKDSTFNNLQITIENAKKLLSFGIYGRDVDLDKKIPATESLETLVAKNVEKNNFLAIEV